MTEPDRDMTTLVASGESPNGSSVPAVVAENRSNVPTNARSQPRVKFREESTANGMRLKRDKSSGSTGGRPRIRRWVYLTVLIVGACVGAVVSAVQSVDKQIDDALTARDLTEWNLNFAKQPHRHSGSEPALSTEDSKALEGALAMVKHNRDLGIAAWTNLERRQLELVLGTPPIELWRSMSYHTAPVYFDRHLHGFIVNFDNNMKSRTYPASLEDISPALQSVAPKFHLKPSRYLPEILGLDPDYVHERIVCPRSLAGRQIGR